MTTLLRTRPAEMVKGPTVRSLFKLPPAAIRRLAGQPVERDGKTLDPEMQLILRLMEAEGPEASVLPLVEARRAIVAGARAVGGRPPVGSVSDRTIQGPGGDLMLRFYTPSGVTSVGPALVLLHGGGWIYGDLESHDALCRFLAERARVRVVAVDYRLAPEHPFPAAVDDAWAAYRWVVEHAEGIGVDPTRVAVGGDSAGGNLAAVVAQTARDTDDVQAPRFQLLIYPGTDFVERRPSKMMYDEGFFLTHTFIDLAQQHYLLSEPSLADPRLSPLQGDLSGLAPAYVVTAGFDPLLDEGEEYARRMSAAGSKVDYVCERGLIHSFANMVSLGRSAPEAMGRAADALAAALHG